MTQEYYIILAIVLALASVIFVGILRYVVKVNGKWRAANDSYSGNYMYVKGDHDEIKLYPDGTTSGGEYGTWKPFSKRLTGKLRYDPNTKVIHTPVQESPPVSIDDFLKLDPKARASRYLDLTINETKINEHELYKTAATYAHKLERFKTNYSYSPHMFDMKKKSLLKSLIALECGINPPSSPFVTKIDDLMDPLENSGLWAVALEELKCKRNMTLTYALMHLPKKDILDRVRENYIKRLFEDAVRREYPLQCWQDEEAHERAVEYAASDIMYGDMGKKPSFLSLYNATVRGAHGKSYHLSPSDLHKHVLDFCEFMEERTLIKLRFKGEITVETIKGAYLTAASMGEKIKKPYGLDGKIYVTSRFVIDINRLRELSLNELAYSHLHQCPFSRYLLDAHEKANEPKEEPQKDNDMIVNDITVEKERTYVYADDFRYTIKKPVKLYRTGKKHEGVGGESHRVLDKAGIVHYVPAGWRALTWVPRGGEKPVQF